MLEVIQFIGFMLVVVFAATGAYIWLRWGYCGAELIWKSRKALDGMIKEDIQETILSSH